MIIFLTVACLVSAALGYIIKGAYNKAHDTRTPLAELAYIKGFDKLQIYKVGTSWVCSLSREDIQKGTYYSADTCRQLEKAVRAYLIQVEELRNA